MLAAILLSSPEVKVARDRAAVSGPSLAAPEHSSE
jgi:hypothetical protein